MIKIAIIDDEENVLDMIKKVIHTTKDLEDEIEVSCYLSAEHALEEFRAGNRFDVVFSDIQLKQMDGIEFGKRLKALYPSIYLVFITSYSEYAAKSYTINAYQYILKDELKKRLPEILERIVGQICKARNEYRILRVNNDYQKLYYKDIVYIKKIKSRKYVQFYTLHEEYRERTTLDAVYQDLSEDFIKIERGYVVNIRHILRMKGNTIYLANGDEVAISRARFVEVKEQINMWWGKLV